MTDYIALIHKDAHSDYGVSFPDLPGCVTAGRTLDEARIEAEAVLALHLAGMRDDGERWPDASNLETVMADAVHRDAVALVVAGPKPEAGPIELTFSRDDLDRIDAVAARRGLSRTAFLMEAARRAVFDSDLSRSDPR